MVKKALFFQLLAILFGILTGYINNPTIILIASNIAQVFVSCLKWFSLPMIVFSILNATSNMGNKQEFYALGLKTLKYTILTTIIAASTALGYFKLLNPTIHDIDFINSTTGGSHNHDIFGILLFSGVIGSILGSLILINLKSQYQSTAKKIFSSIYNRILALIQYLPVIMPFAIWAFVTLFLADLNSSAVKNLTIYLSSILSANITQAFVILPLLLLFKKISPLKVLKGMLSALNLAFWSKSSGVTLPVTLTCAKENLKIKPKIANFVLPICTTVNMNACAAFILITVLFVATSHGIAFSPYQLIAWIFISTLAAIGNAGVPLGCFTMASALLSYIGAPLYLLGLILPFYSLIDMLESAINVWSDSCITCIIDKET